MQYAQPGRLLRKGNTPRSVESSHPVASAHVLDAHRRAGPRRVDEAIVAEENSHVGIGSPLGVVENQVRSEEHTLNSSHRCISYAVFCLKKKIKFHHTTQ